MKKKSNFLLLSSSRYLPLLYSRRVSQLLFFGIFVFLFIRTDYRGSDQLEYAVNILFRLDPFLAAVTMAAAGTIIALMLPAVVVLILALIFGRSFCGWVCPMGTLLDGCNHVMPTNLKGRETLYPRAGRIIFWVVLVLAFFGFHMAGYVDPFAILVRGLAQTFYPIFHGMTETFFTWTYTSAPAFVNGVTEPVYAWMKDVVLPAERKYFQLVSLSFVILIVVLLLEMAQKRFFCRNICPLGAMLGMVSRRGLQRVGGGSDQCGKCRICASLCRMGAIDEERRVDMSTCNLCVECAVKCPRQVIGFSFYGIRQAPLSTSLSRRHFFGIMVAGVLLPSLKGADVLAKSDDPFLIRPPGALPEAEFLGRCVRCGECLQVCIGNALQPVLLEAGLDGIFSPKLVARTGYCEFNCTLCGQVCPTGAISVLTLAQKHHFKIGNAWFDRDRCLPYAKGIPCIVCEEHCPTAEKAIRFRMAEVYTSDGAPAMVKQPYVVDDLCIGCGICETKCPLPGRSAIIVTNANEDRNPGKKLPSATVLPYG